MIRIPFARDVRPGDTLGGEVMLPEGPPPRTVVVVFHGFLQHREWGGFPVLHRRLVAAGHGVVAVDFSRNGVVGGAVVDTDRFRRNTVSLERDEARTVVRAVLDEGLLPRPPRAVGLLGHGRGGALAVLIAADEPRVAGLVTWAAPTTLDRWSEATRAEWRAAASLSIPDPDTGRHLPLDVTLLEDIERNRAGLDVLAAAARVAAPWLVVHGEEDVRVPSHEGRELARVAPHGRLRRVEGVGHDFGAAAAGKDRVVVGGFASAGDATVDHLTRVLGVAARRNRLAGAV